MGRYLLVLDTDLLALDEKLDLEPINYLVERQEQEQCDVVVLSPVNTGQTKPSSLELLLGGTTSHAIYTPAKFPTASRPDHDVNAAAEHRMNLTVRHLTNISCQASGLISDEDLVKAVDAETRGHEYEVILATSGHDGSWQSPKWITDKSCRMSLSEASRGRSVLRVSGTGVKTTLTLGLSRLS
jgi:hypothetical protein